MNKIHIETRVYKDLQTTWECYTNPQHITKWNFASDDWCCPHAEVDLREGGKAVSRMEAKDGSFGFDFVVTYSEMQRQGWQAILNNFKKYVELGNE